MGGRTRGHVLVDKGLRGWAAQHRPTRRRRPEMDETTPEKAAGTPPEGGKDFWNEKAKTFPRYEAGEDNYEAGILRIIREYGVDFRGRTVLDVGCGCGMYTIRLAKEARHVTAVDISEQMLHILRHDAESHGLSNIRYVLSGWEEFEDHGCYDVVFCSMTPAIHDDATRRKLLRHARGWTIFMGFAGRMSSNVLSGLFAHYQVTPKVFNNGPEMRHWLEDQGISHISRLIEGQWVVPMAREGMISSCTSMLMPYGITPDPDYLKEYIEQFRTEPEKYVETTDYRIELLLWR